jgi:hypothetical protein
MTAPFMYVPPTLLNPADVPDGDFEGFRVLIEALHQVSARAEENVRLLHAVPDVDNAARRARFRELAEPMRRQLNDTIRAIAGRSVSRNLVELQRWRDRVVCDARRLLAALSEA